MAKEKIPGFIYVPSINLYVAEHRSLFESDWTKSQELHKNDEKMPTIPEFWEFLKHIKENDPWLYDYIRNPNKRHGTSEWLDANFNMNNNGLHVDYHIFENGKIKKQTEKLDKNTLCETSKINLGDLLINPTNQGLPKKEIPSGNFGYEVPIAGSIVRLNISKDNSYLECNRDPSYWGWDIGVRICKDGGDQ